MRIYLQVAHVFGFSFRAGAGQEWFASRSSTPECHRLPCKCRRLIVGCRRLLDERGKPFVGCRRFFVGCRRLTVNRRQPVNRCPCLLIKRPRLMSKRRRLWIGLKKCGFDSGCFGCLKMRRPEAFSRKANYRLRRLCIMARPLTSFFDFILGEIDIEPIFGLQMAAKNQGDGLRTW